MRFGGKTASMFFMPAGPSKQPSIKSAASRIIRDLPASASWEDLMYQIVARQKIERGLADIKAGRTHSHEDVLKKFGLAK